jgi:hypothetical protein
MIMALSPGGAPPDAFAGAIDMLGDDPAQSPALAGLPHFSMSDR